jgi:hypothetical protein
MILLLFVFILFIGILSAIYLLTALNPISRLIYLIVIFVMSSFLYLLLDYYFLGLTYIIVYVGAIAILFLFIIMMSEKNPDGLTGSRTFNDKPNVSKFKFSGAYLVSSANSVNSVGGIASGANSVTVGSYTYINEGTRKIRYFLIVLFSLLSILYLNPDVVKLMDPALSARSFELNAIGISSISNLSNIYSYFLIDYSTDFINFTDLNVLGFILYLAYPFITLILAILLWIVLIGILKISSPQR